MISGKALQRLAKCASRQAVQARRWSSTEAGHPRAPSSSNGNSSKDIFETDEPKWEGVFEGITPSASNVLASSGWKHHSQRVTMTARERNAFDEMFNMIFETWNDMKMPAGSPAPGSYESTLGVGNKSALGPLADNLRVQSRNTKWTTEAEQELDRKKEDMSLCDTDQQLLDWALREVFGESQRCEAAARKALLDPSSSPPSTPLQPLWYPHIIAHLMQAFRDRYGDPHLALSIFDHARHLSIASYVFGCTTPAYNELIETRWRCFRDVRGVCDALEEMQVNGIDMDAKTRQLAERVRREVGERNMWEEETALDSGEVWKLLTRIERLIAEPSVSVKRSNGYEEEGGRRREKKWTNISEPWKREAVRPSAQNTYEFGKWGEPEQ
ncbi:hypothetical protein PsYK624_052750 [Phanerochaete sordida]|uniref:Mtf2-like C-terminal domain-containing protein n=1 Tax=Phanerochaete sordida TaxID=48140 RepID=A0A9P3G7E3_9APHY|nr:hypothetical protein PsYK624_052750 [Phanerochaete sordida]